MLSLLTEENRQQNEKYSFGAADCREIIFGTWHRLPYQTNVTC